MSPINIEQELENYKSQVANLEQYKNLFFKINDKYISAKSELDQLHALNSELDDALNIGAIDNGHNAEYEKIKLITENQKNIISQLQAYLKDLEKEDSINRTTIEKQLSQLSELQNSINDYQSSFSSLKESYETLKKEKFKTEKNAASTKPYNNIQAQLENSTTNTSINREEKLHTLEQKLEETTSTSFEHMMNNADLSSVIMFLINSYSVKSNSELVELLFETIDSYNLQAVIQIRQKEEVENFSSQGAIELSDLNIINRHKNTQYWKNEDQFLISTKSFSLLTHKMPSQTSDRYNRTCDNLKALAQGAEARIRNLNKENNSLKQQKSLQHLVKNTAVTLTKAEKKYQKQTQRVSSLLSEILVSLNERMKGLGFTQEQETQIVQLIVENKKNLEQIYHDDKLIDQQFLQIIKRLYTGYFSQPD